MTEKEKLIHHENILGAIHRLSDKKPNGLADASLMMDSMLRLIQTANAIDRLPTAVDLKSMPIKNVTI